MNDSNREGMGPSNRLNRSTPRQLWLALVLALVATVFVGRAWNEWRGDGDVKQAGADYKAFMAAVRQADGMADPLQRCLHYPVMPGTHWSDETTAAYCQLRNRQTLQRSDIAALLQQGKAAEVDRAFQGYLNAQLHDPKQPGLLDAAFYSAGFHDADAAARTVIDLWKQQAPDSAFALAASGMQYVAAAQEARGNGWGRDLGDDQVDGMHQQLVLARKDLDRAVTLLPSVTPAYTSMVYAGALEGDEGYSYRAARNGLAVDPANFALRGQMMNFAQPKWGSEFGGESEQKREAEAGIGRNPLLVMVAQYPAVYRATCDCEGTRVDKVHLLMEAADKNATYGSLSNLADEAYSDNARYLAVELYSESLRFNPVDPDVLQWRAHQIAMLGDTDGAIESVAQAARRFPKDNAIGTKLGNIYAFTGHVKEAESAFLAVIQRDPDNVQAMGELGDLYNHAGHQPDKAEALADTLISRHPDNAAGYIVRSCNQMDHNLPGVYDTLHYFIDHFGDDPQWKTQTDEMRAYLVHHPENVSAS